MKKESQKLEIVRKKGLKKLLQKKNIRSTADAKRELEFSVHVYSAMLSDLAQAIAQEQGRKRITGKDINEAKKRLIYEGGK